MAGSVVTPNLDSVIIALEGHLAALRRAATPIRFTTKTCSAQRVTMSGVDPVGIVSVGVYSPEKFMTAGEIAQASGLPEWAVREKR